MATLSLYLASYLAVWMGKLLMDNFFSILITLLN